MNYSVQLSAGEDKCTGDSPTPT